MVDGLWDVAGVVTVSGDRLGLPQQVLHALVSDLPVEDAPPPQQHARPAQHRIGRRLDDMCNAVVVGHDRLAVGDPQLVDGESRKLPVRDRGVCGEG